MANRHTLHISRLDAFREWLEKHGWTICKISNNPYEVLRAKKEGVDHPLIVYKKQNAKEHLTFASRDIFVIHAFMRDSKKKDAENQERKTNADRIRAMSDEELAEMLHNIGSYVEDGNPLIDIWIGEKKTTLDDSVGFIKEWLQSESEEV